MTYARLQAILEAIPRTRVLILGDFFLDQYWEIDPHHAEVSLETGLEAHQVVSTRLSPGAAGTVAGNLSALGVGEIHALGLIGDDGSGFELLRRLQERGVRTEALLRDPDRATPVYTKPLHLQPDGSWREASRFDWRSRSRTPLSGQSRIIQQLERLLPQVDAVAVMDQIEATDCGSVTRQVRESLAQLALRYPQVFILADSRNRIGDFRHMSLKPNEHEARQALGAPPELPVAELARRLGQQSRRAVILTRGAAGLLLAVGTETRAYPALPLSGPLDPVGAGDSTSAALVAARAAGASFAEAAQLALLASAVTVRKLGTTGTASPAEIVSLAHEFPEICAQWGI